MGSFEEVKKLDARTVLQRLNYEQYKSEYEEEYMEMNKNEHS